MNLHFYTKHHRHCFSQITGNCRHSVTQVHKYTISISDLWEIGPDVHHFCNMWYWNNVYFSRNRIPNLEDQTHIKSHSVTFTYGHQNPITHFFERFCPPSLGSNCFWMRNPILKITTYQTRAHRHSVPSSLWGWRSEQKACLLNTSGTSHASFVRQEGKRQIDQRRFPPSWRWYNKGTLTKQAPIQMSG